MKQIKCPNCGVQHYQENNYVSTAMYCPVIVKNGQVLTDDENYYTTNCTCLACGYDFQIVKHKGKVIVR